MVRAPRETAIDDDGNTRISYPRHPAMALCRRRAGFGDGPGRRRHPAHRIRPLDHRVEAGDGHAAAARRKWVAGRVREISGHPAIPRAQCRHESRAIQDHLLVGMGASAARPADRRGVFAAVSLVPVARLGGTGAAGAAVVHFRARRAARWRRLVDGRLRPRRPRRSLAISAGDASRARLRDLCGADLDRAAAERAAGFTGAARGRG